jgi:hypothetical protein
MLTQIAQGKTGTSPGTTVLTIPDAGAFGAVPNDFDVSRAHLDYQRFYHGWVPGTLGQSEIDYGDPQAVEAAMAELKVLRARLAAEREVADLKHTKSSRLWMVIGGVVGVATLAVSIYALRRSS